MRTKDAHIIAFNWEPNQILIDGTTVGEFGYSISRDMTAGGARIGAVGIDTEIYIYIDGNKHHIQLKD